MKKSRFFVALMLASLTARPGLADDKDFLRPIGDKVPPNLLIVFGNSQTLTQTISFTGTATSTWDGDGDSPASKLGSGKRVIKQFITDFSGDYNIGLTTFSHDPNAGSVDIDSKHWVYESLDVDFPNETWAEPVGTLSRWGPGGEGPCTNRTVPACTDRSPAIALPNGNQVSVTGPFFGATGTGSAYINLSNTARIKHTLVTGKYGDAFTNDFTDTNGNGVRDAGEPLTLATMTISGTHSMVVLKEYQTKSGSTWTTQLATPNGSPGTVNVRYRPPSNFPPELFYTDTFDSSSPLLGDEIGFLNDPQGDFDVNANCSGWEFQTNADQVPLVKIPRDYYWGVACNPPQDSLPCVKRVLRPQAYIETYDSSTGAFTTTDPNNPGYTGSGSKYADGCDPNLLGAVQAGLDVVENNAILTNLNGSQAPIKNLLENIFAYFSDPKHDNFKNGARMDDPNAFCRNSAVILIYDNFNGCQNDSCNFLKNHVLTNLKAIGIPVFVIGFGAQANQGVCAADPLTDACPLVCIPQHSGALKLDGTPGYFPVTSDVELYQALATIASLVNESQKGFVGSTVAVAQASGEQVAYLPNFNAANNRSIWNGRVNAYKLDASGQLQFGVRTIKDPNDPNVGATIPAPKNTPDSLMWNAGENLSDTPGTGATNSSAVLSPGAARSTSTYVDTSNDSTSVIGTSFYPGRKIVFSLPQSYPDPAAGGTTLPFPAADAVPENRFDMIADTGATWWAALKGLLSPQSTPPFVLTPPIDDGDAADSLRFIWGDRDSVILAAEPAAPANKLYSSSAAERAAGKGLKLGDLFHSNPALVGAPGNTAYFFTNLNNYQAFRETYRRRRRVLYIGANDGLLHAFDAGAWFRNQNQCDLLPDGTRAKCYDLGTGTELFAYAPRSIMQIFKSLKDTRGPQTKRNEWTVDGPPTAGDVFIDSSHSGTPNPSERSWHTVLVGGMREGSAFEGTSGASPADSLGSYYALDITQPDELTVDGSGNVVPPGGNDAFIASYTAPMCLNASGDPSCGKDAADPAVRASQPARAWPTVLWEISDTGDLEAGVTGAPGAGYYDMGETWSRPSMGRVKVCTANCGNTSDPFPVTEDRYVAIFGGGFDRERLNRRGNWLYMVDVETGHVLYRANSSCGVNSGAGCSPVYFGSITGTPSTLDTNDDGAVDVLYFGDLKGRVWRVDTTDLRLLSGATGRFANKIDVDSGSGKPFLFFEAPQPVAPAVHPFYPIYYRPTAITLGYNVGGKAALGIAFGTGDRDDITSAIEPLALTYPQRFYYVVDRNNNATRTEGELLNIATPTAAPTNTVPANGWFIQLNLGERVNTDSIAVAGVIFFTVFNPLNALNPANPCAQNTPECGLANGTGRLYEVYYSTGNPYAGDDRGTAVPYGGFLSDPVAFQAADQTVNVWINNQESSIPPEKGPGNKQTSVKSWKERSRRQ
jgi:hypothetical protein